MQSFQQAKGCMMWGLAAVAVSLAVFSMGSAAFAQAPAGQAACDCAAKSAAPENAVDVQFKAIYTADAKWRRAAYGESDEDEKKHLQPAHIPHVDAATQQRELEHWNDVVMQLDKLDAARLSADERVNFEVYRAQVVVDRNDQAFREYERPANSDSQFWGEIAPDEREQFRSQEAVERYLSRLKDVPRYFDEQIANMQAGEARGFTPPQITLAGRDQSIKLVADAQDPTATDFYKPLLKLPDSISAAEQATLRAEAKDIIAEQIIPAYVKLLKFWDDDYVPHATKMLAADSLPDGKAYYQSKILEFATVTMTPAEIHDFGVSEVAKIHAEMVAAMKDSGYKGTFEEFLTYLRTAPQFYAKTPQELLDHAAWVAKEFDGVASRYFGYEPRGRFAIVPVPPEIAPFYTAGRGGTGVYLLNTYDLASRPLYALPALTLHESAPGHSWQGAIAQEQERDKHLPNFRRQYISAYGEGWALYCERLGDEMGIYKTPYERFGMLSYQAWRAARLVVDTGIHAQGWTRAQAQQFLHENTALSDHEIETEVDRYISWPGQALSYYLGESDIWRLRHKAEATLGTKFNLRAFHDEIMSLGSVPLPVLDEQVDAFIAGGGVGPYPEMER
jgi:uncharacterized protein (DUF885 family)